MYLAQYSKKTSNGELPNLVFVIIEGFGQKLTGIDSATVSFTPFLDSLANNGLYWKNCLSTAERTFGALPAIFASAPHGEGGFASKWHPIPDHNSLLNDLVQNGYTTSFFYGGSASFDGQDAFLIRNGINYILDAQPDTNDIAQTTKLKNNHRWGLDDSQMIDLAIAHKQTESTIPFADIYLTLTTHEPFEFPGIDQYIQKIAHWDENATDIERQNIDGNLNIFATFNYADDCIRKLFEYYKSRPDYQNTIFIIVGDHRMCPLLAPNNPLMKYHIPLILYSPLLVTNKSMNSVVSHLDITPTINAYLSKNYHYTTSPQCHWLGTTLDTSNTFLCKKDLAFMLNNRDVIDFLSDTMMISGNRLFHVNSDLSVIPTENNAVLDSLTTLLNSYQTISKYVIKNDYLKKNIEGAKESLVNLNLDFDHNVPSEFKKQLYNKNGNMCMLIDSTIEYGTLCSKIDLQKKCKKIKVVIMFDFQSSDTSKKLPKIVIEAGNYYLASPIDSALNTGLSEKYQLTTTIDIEDKDNATMKIYLWNPNHSRMTYDNLMIKIDILN